MNNNAPIGIFDSGLGGLSVLQKLTELLPREKFIYLGDQSPAGTEVGTYTLGPIIP